MVLVGCHFKQVVREDCTEEVGSEQKPEGAEEGRWKALQEEGTAVQRP